MLYCIGGTVFGGWGLYCIFKNIKRSIYEIYIYEANISRINGGQDHVPQEGYTETVTAVRYNNNAIHELNDLMTTMTDLVVNPTAISWLDFSFNDIHQLDDVRCVF